MPTGRPTRACLVLSGDMDVHSGTPTSCSPYHFRAAISVSFRWINRTRHADPEGFSRASALMAGVGCTLPEKDFYDGVSLAVAWIGLSRLEIMAKFMATRVGDLQAA